MYMGANCTDIFNIKRLKIRDFHIEFMCDY